MYCVYVNLRINNAFAAAPCRHVLQDPVHALFPHKLQFNIIKCYSKICARFTKSTLLLEVLWLKFVM